MNALDELRAYASLLEHSTKIPPVVGLRLGELANEVAKDLQHARQNTSEPTAWMPSDGIMVKHYTANMDGTVSPAPAPEAVLLKEMADWWGRINTKHLATQQIYDELRDLTRRAFNIVNS